MPPAIARFVHRHLPSHLSKKGSSLWQMDGGGIVSLK
jgi:hypothetical protein